MNRGSAICADPRNSDQLRFGRHRASESAVAVFELFTRPAGAQVIAPELLEQFNLAAFDRANAALYACFAGEALTPLAGPFESSGCRGHGHIFA